MADIVETRVPGTVWKVLVKPGDAVAEGQELFILEVMKTEVPHAAERAGTVKTVNIAEEQAVDAGFAAVEIDS